MVLKKWEVYVIAYTVYHGSFKIHVSWSTVPLQSKELGGQFLYHSPL